MIEVFQRPALSDNFAYLLREPRSGLTAAVDTPAAEPLIELLEEKGWKLDFIFNTHHHRDHVGANRALLEAACEGLQEQGMAVAEANPRPGTDDPGANHRGPLSLYLAAGFTIDREDESDGTVFVRKSLVSL